MSLGVSDPGHDPAEDAWAENFVFSNSDGYLELVWTATPDEYDDADQHVVFVEAGDKMTDLLRKMRTFTPTSVGTAEVESDDDDVADDTGSEFD